MTKRLDLIIILGLFLALILFVALGPGRGQPEEPDIPTSYSSAGGGALALYRWLGELGYDVRRLEYRPFELDDTTAALVILSPGDQITRQQARDTLDWVERGGTLILADDTPAIFSGSRALFDELQVDVRVLDPNETIERAPVVLPAFDQPPARELTARTGRVLVPRVPDVAALAGEPGATVLAGVSRGDGYVYLSTATHLFTNDGLREEGSAALALNMLRRVPSGGRILFDEIHHGRVTPPAAGGLLGSPWGWAAAYASVAVVMYLLLSGRRFGRPVPLREEVARRSSAEYVESMADLFQRGGKRSYILRHYYEAFKRRLARPYGISPQLPDDAFAAELARAGEVDEALVRDTLARLRAAPAGEAELVRAVAESEEAIERLLARAAGRQR